MAVQPRIRQIDAMMDKASKALAGTDYFDAEALALQALGLAREARDYERMARIVLPLQEARRQRLQLALGVGTVTIIDEPLPEQHELAAGCYLVRPPQVGADARRLRLAAIQQKVPVAAVCREPLTQIKLCPIVAIGPGVTIRTKIDPPADPDDIDLGWFVGAMEALGDHAIDVLDAGLATEKRVDVLVGALDAIPDHERLHQALAEACRRAAHEMVEAG